MKKESLLKRNYDYDHNILVSLLFMYFSIIRNVLCIDVHWKISVSMIHIDAMVNGNAPMAMMKVAVEVSVIFEISL